ncbi:hypothetical protein SeMB42_g00945 [Synchytrium endobioticum]|uniref:Uncharacterized protein n=1 Tax=Synchytrium endobioticum TaxID=286115 RepID=A0A507DQG8_9FUNG|nr:hypothetical protein SeMB42_g00945 [Synchytrium endobioticum]
MEGTLGHNGDGSWYGWYHLRFYTDSICCSRKYVLSTGGENAEQIYDKLKTHQKKIGYSEWIHGLLDAFTDKKNPNKTIMTYYNRKADKVQKMMVAKQNCTIKNHNEQIKLASLINGLGESLDHFKTHTFATVADITYSSLFETLCQEESRRSRMKGLERIEMAAEAGLLEEWVVVDIEVAVLLEALHQEWEEVPRHGTHHLTDDKVQFWMVKYKIIIAILVEKKVTSQGILSVKTILNIQRTRGRGSSSLHSGRIAQWSDYGIEDEEGYSAS